jgi:hydroxymethylbilane synthase
LVPIGAVTRLDGSELFLRGVVLQPDGAQRIEGTLSGPADDPEHLGQRLADELATAGARQLLSL